MERPRVPIPKTRPESGREQSGWRKIRPTTHACCSSSLDLPEYVALKVAAKVVNEGVDKLTRLWRLGFNLVEAVIGAGPHVEGRIHAGRIEVLGKGHGFIAEKVDAAYPDPRWRQAGKITARGPHQMPAEPSPRQGRRRRYRRRPRCARYPRPAYRRILVPSAARHSTNRGPRGMAPGWICGNAGPPQWHRARPPSVHFAGHTWPGHR